MSGRPAENQERRPGNEFVWPSSTSFLPNFWCFLGQIKDAFILSLAFWISFFFRSLGVNKCLTCDKDVVFINYQLLTTNIVFFPARTHCSVTKQNQMETLLKLSLKESCYRNIFRFCMIKQHGISSHLSL